MGGETEERGVLIHCGQEGYRGKKWLTQFLEKQPKSTGNHQTVCAEEINCQKKAPSSGRGWDHVLSRSSYIG